MNTEDRLSRMESRLAAIELYLRKSVTAPTSQAGSQGTVNPASATAASAPSSPATAAKILPTQSSGHHREASSSVTNILGWAGATALVLASVYLVVLAIDAGWLTPARQLMLSMLGGFLCIGLGLVLRNRDMHYASLLPAAGIVVLFTRLPRDRDPGPDNGAKV